MGSWADFFVAELGAAAALTGLVIVAISINVTRILAHPLLPGRAAETLVAPTGVLVVASCALIPHQPDWLFASELGVIGALMWLIPVWLQARVIGSGESYSSWRFLVPRALLGQFSSLPFLVAAVLIVLGHSSGLYWIVPGVVVSLIVTVINAWVLLVEILR
ncbi:MAG TPA: hypothetical protein VHU87_10850 [Rhizomicrobium sp.]|jgi:hypothetical protein|nr:hypothetical protein [Rhizomicrobium sp.]